MPSTQQTPWALNRQFLDVIARSGTTLFVSVDPTTRTDAVDADLSAALRLALDGGDPSGVEPVDWLNTTFPGAFESNVSGDSRFHVRGIYRPQKRLLAVDSLPAALSTGGWCGSVL